MLEQLQEDIKQFNGAMEDFYNLVPEDIEGAYQNQKTLHVYVSIQMFFLYYS